MTTPPAGSPKFAEMTGRQKVVFVFKITVCLISFGLIYPNILND
jgi:hypothetical protein